MADTQIILRNGQLPLYLELLQNDHGRTTLNANAGIANRFAFGNSRVYMAAGTRLSVSANRSSHPVATTSITAAAQPNQLDGTEMFALLEEVRQKTGGTFDLDHMPLRMVMDTIGRYPALVKPEQAATIAAISNKLGETTKSIESTRQWLVGYLATQSDIPQAQQLRASLSRPLTTGTLDRITVSDIREQSANAARALQAISKAMTLNPPTAQQMAMIEQYEKMVMAQMGQQAPNVPASQRVAQALAVISKTQTELTQFNTTIPRFIEPSELAHVYDQARKIMAYDPVVRATAYVAALQESQPFATQARVVWGGMSELGSEINVDSIRGVREGSSVKLRLTPAHVTSHRVFAGIGSGSAAIAVPPGMENIFGLPLARGGEMGAHLIYEETRCSAVTQKNIAIGLRYTLDSVTEISGDVKCPLKPAQTPCAKAVSFVRKF